MMGGVITDLAGSFKSTFVHAELWTVVIASRSASKTPRRVAA